jgi:ABC-type transport system involved in cytochrome bd biosynthesis fused ATPase/permease subunit
MLRSIPWDVWIAATLAVVVAIVAFFDPGPAVFIALYLGLCAYIAAQTFGNERDT